jgi:hypothetical protein
MDGVTSIRGAFSPVLEDRLNSSKGIPLGGPVGGGARGIQTCRQRIRKSYPLGIHTVTLVDLRKWSPPRRTAIAAHSGHLRESVPVGVPAVRQLGGGGIQSKLAAAVTLEGPS